MYSWIQTYMYAEWDHVQRLFFIMQRSERYENSRKPLASYYLLFSFNPHLQFVYNFFFAFLFLSSSLLFSCVFARWKRKLSERKIAIHIVLMKHKKISFLSFFFIHFFFIFNSFFFCKIMKKQHRVRIKKSHKELDGWNKEHSWLSTSYVIITNVLYSC